MEKHEVKRGDIYLYDFGENPGSIQNGFRPVLVIQSDMLNQSSPTTVVAAMTTAIKKRYLPSHVFVSDSSGLVKPSMVMLEQLKTVNQNELHKFIGHVDSDYLSRQINVGLKKEVGLWVERPRRNQNDIRCLCGRCLNDYKTNPGYVVRRLNPFAKEKGQCERCDSLGWDYLIYTRKAKKEGNNV